MQVANILLSLAGDSGNTVPKSNVTAAEVAVLRLIHGEESVRDIEPIGTVERTNRGERQRLVARYGRMEEGQLRAKAVDALFPGVAARVYEAFEELELPEEFYKPQSRVSSAGVSERDRTEAEQAEISPQTEVIHPLDHDGDGKKGGSKKSARKAAAKVEAEPEPTAEADPAPAEQADDADGIEDMPDGDLFK